MSHLNKIRIVGGGLAGCEAAWQCLRAGLSVTLYEMRPSRMTEAHKGAGLAELVCSNSLKSLSLESAPGQLKREMSALNSLVVEAAKAAQVPAGQALAVDRDMFSQYIEQRLAEYDNFDRVSAEVDEQLIASYPDDFWIIATGPLTSSALVPYLESLCEGQKRLYFYDAIAPVIDADSIDMSKAFWASRYDKGDADYLNIPLSKDDYESFIDDVSHAETMPLHDFEGAQYFESCLPIEVMIARGRETLRFGPLKPVGLKDPKTGQDAHAVIQLRKENKQATMLSMVGFQTKMKWPEQKRVFQKIPGLEAAEFLRLGSIHRNTYINSPKLLDTNFAFRSSPNIHIAGQITGVEGYTESAAIGLMVGLKVAAKAKEQNFMLPPATTFLGALTSYVLEGPLGEYQPMNVNFGLLPNLPVRKVKKSVRKLMHCERASRDMDTYLENAKDLESLMKH